MTFNNPNQPSEIEQYQNMLLSAVRTPQTTLQSNLHNIKYETQSFPQTQLQSNLSNLNTNTNHLSTQSTAMTNQFIQLLTQLVSLNNAPNQINNQSNQNYNNNYSTVPSINSTNPSTTCKSVKTCASIRKIIKLGIFQRKYGTSNQHKIAEFINNCSEYASLDYDYQHSLIFHYTNADKKQIVNMSKEYEVIYDFIHNFQNKKFYNSAVQTVHNNQNNVSLDELIYYNNTMDNIYNGIDNNKNKSDNSGIDNNDDTSSIFTSHSSNSATTSSPYISINSNENVTNNIFVTPIPSQNIQTKTTQNQNIVTILPIQSMPPGPPSVTNTGMQFHNNNNTNNIPYSIQPILKQPPPKTIVRPPQYKYNNNIHKILLNKNNPFSCTNTTNYLQIQQQTKDVKVKFNKMNANNGSLKPIINNKFMASNHNNGMPEYITKLENKSSNNTRKFKCSDCGKTYKHMCNLKSHQKIHTPDALVCPHCKKRFGRKANYKEHLRIHTGETPYQCKYCKRKFKHHHSWKDHVRIHTGEKPYECNQCRKKFKVGHNLTVHYRIHTGEKPYSCLKCMKTFRQKSALNSHMKRVHC